jgi:hypothetical protein
MCAGCVPFQSTQIGPGTFEISTPVSVMNDYGGAVITLDYRSKEVCPAGYEKVADRTTREQGNELLYWQIRCRH